MQLENKINVSVFKQTASWCCVRNNNNLTTLLRGLAIPKYWTITKITEHFQHNCIFKTDQHSFYVNIEKKKSN